MLITVSIWQTGFSVYASPSVSDCSDNPGLEGCGDKGPAEKQKELVQNDDSLLLNLVQLFFALLLVLGLIYGLLKFFNRKNKMFGKTQKLENLGGLSLGPNRSLQLVKVADRVMVIGVGENVEMVTEITDEATKKALVDNGEEEFLERQFLSDLFKKKEKKQNFEGHSGQSKVQFQHLFEKELASLKEKREKLHKTGQREDKRDE